MVYHRQTSKYTLSNEICWFFAGHPVYRYIIFIIYSDDILIEPNSRSFSVIFSGWCRFAIRLPNSLLPHPPSLPLIFFDMLSLWITSMFQVGHGVMYITRIDCYNFEKSCTLISRLWKRTVSLSMLKKIILQLGSRGKWYSC